MAYSVYIDGLKLPITPAKLSTKIKGQNSTINLITGEEINILKKAGLTEISFDAVIPAFQYYYADQLQSQKTFFDKFEDLKVNEKRFQFIVTRQTPDGKAMYNTNLKMALEEYELPESYDDGFDVPVKIKLKQAPDYGTKTVNIPDPASPQQVATVEETRPTDTAPNNQPNYQEYTVVSGDSLWAIAKKMLGDGSRWNEIYNLNKDKISNPNLIYAGQKLTLP